MADSYLNKSGLSYFWDKIKAALQEKVNSKRSYTTATTVSYKKITVIGGDYSTDGTGIILFTREERYVIDGMCASGYGGKCIELGTNHNANNTSATTSNRWVNVKVYGVPESRTTEIYCRMSPYTYVDVHSSGTITIANSTETEWTAATNNATYIPLTAPNNATLTIQKNGADVQTFTANATSNKTANITVPTKISDLTNTSGGLITYCTCASAAADTTKVITVDSGDSNWVLRKGTVIAVRFTNTNTASNVKFNVGGSGDKSVYYNTAVNTGNSNSIFGYANRTVLYVYDGTNWVWLSDSRHDGNDNTYTTAYCNTAAGTAAKTASMTGYVLTANRYTVLTITNANTAASALTLNINGKGAKPLYINGTASSSTNHTLPAGSYIVWYDGTNYYIYNNGEIPRMIHSEEPVSVTSPSTSVSGSEITDGSITYAKTATGEFLKLQLSTVDIGEGVSLPPNTLYGVYE